MTALIFIATILVIVVGIIVYFQLAPQIGEEASGARLQKMKSSKNYKEGKFQNLIATSIDMGFTDNVKVGWEMLSKGKKLEPEGTIETVAFNSKDFQESVNDEVVITWFGHSSLLIKIDGNTFLTDPVFSDRASMFSFMGPKKFPYTYPVTVNDLPTIDAVIISHDHYDHLDYQTIVQLKEKVNKFFVPLGVGAHLEKWGIPENNITELDWWDSTSMNDISLVCTPARHFSGRGFTRDKALWASWVIKGTQQKVFFGGDSGYFPGFKEIGDRHGPFDIVLLECGAYNELWSSIHMMPEETAQASLDLKGYTLMPIHWGKFNLALHHWKEPIERLSKRAKELDVSVVTPRVGELTVVKSKLPVVRWW